MWISKEAEIRRKELLDAALELFYEIGYDNTSINDIIKKVGVTKGAFYYHFKSKEEVLDTIALQRAEEMVNAFHKALDGADGSVVEKLNGIISAMQEYRARTHEERLKVFEVLDKSENAKLRQRIYENYMTLSKPVVEKMIEQGIREGVFVSSFPDELAEFYIQFSLSANGAINKLVTALGERPETMEIIRKKAAFYEEILAKMLGVREGSIRYAEPVLNSCAAYTNLK